MKPLLVLYATREGHTRRIADCVVARARHKGIPAISRDLRSTGGQIDFKTFGAVVLAGPIHAGKHPRELVRFVKAKRGTLSQVPTLLITVCLAQAGVENPNTPAKKRAEAERAIQALNEDFIKQTEFRPTQVKTVAGALPYTQYNFFIRWVMKRIVAKEGGDTDTSRDYVYTNWTALEGLVEDFLTECRIIRSTEPDRPVRIQLAS